MVDEFVGAEKNDLHKLFRRLFFAKLSGIPMEIDLFGDTCCQIDIWRNAIGYSTPGIRKISIPFY